MKTIFTLALAAVATIAATSSADARDGCGRGYHRGPYGHCRPNWRNGPAIVVAPGGLVIDRWYEGRGYWDGHRYWMHRDRWHGGWRYR
jgi:hypothetical protein